MKHNTVSQRVVLAIVVVATLGLLPASGPPALAVVREGPPGSGAGAQAMDASMWSSGWMPIAAGQTLTLDHNLGGNVEDYRIQLWFLETVAGGRGIHTLGYGGLEGDGVYSGAFWQNLTPTTIQVTREIDDTAIDRVRVWIWMPEPETQYCTAWANIGQADIVDVYHSLGGNEDDYTVLLWFKEAASLGIHQRAYGGLDDAGGRMGAYWLWLDSNSASVYRYVSDPYVEQFRMCVSLPAQPAVYDSGWQDIDAGASLALTHGVGGNVNGYVVNMEFKDLDALGIHHAGAGGDFIGMARGPDSFEHGAHWENLTNDSIEIVRHPYDSYVDQVRVRIWQRPLRVFLPCVFRNG